MLAELEKITSKTPPQETLQLMLYALKKLDQRTETLSDGVDMSMVNALVDVREEQKETNRSLQTMVKEQQETNSLLKKLIAKQ